MIIYRKASQLRIRRWSAPEPPWFCASAVAPYGAKRGSPLSIDYIDLRASSGERLEVAVCDDVSSEMERNGAKLDAPVLIETSETAEQVFRRGNDALIWAAAHRRPSLQLISTRGALPDEVPQDAVVTVTAWPLDLKMLESLCADLASRGSRWGIAVPVMFPVTTDLRKLAQLSQLAGANRAAFLASIPLEIDATAKQAIAQSLAADGGDEDYAMLFHADLEPVHVATERHIAALAAEAGVEDFVTPPKWEERSNWNAAVLLTLAATRMIAMEHDVELAGTLARSARLVAELDKPLAQIAQEASLSIIDALDEISVDI
ncbi:MAG TPA: hypothetical protein VLU46_15415, partial [Thermoanaerobaculia bacterium]|nr:hypothetical protein [Thermoanaerobaculia bacterium]